MSFWFIIAINNNLSLTKKIGNNYICFQFQLVCRFVKRLLEVCISKYIFVNYRSYFQLYSGDNLTHATKIKSMREKKTVLSANVMNRFFVNMMNKRWFKLLIIFQIYRLIRIKVVIYKLCAKVFLLRNPHCLIGRW